MGKVKENWNLFSDEKVGRFLLDDGEGENHPSRKKVIELLNGWKSVLDVGCGPGLTFEMIQRAYPSMKYTGVDVTEKFILHCQRRFPDHQECFRTLSVFELERLSRSFDVVMCRHLLEHLPDYKQALTQMYATADRRVIVAFYLPPRPLRWARHKVDMRYESPLFYTHVYDLGGFVDFVLNGLAPPAEGVRVYPRQGSSGLRGEAWSHLENVVYEIVKAGG